jgi:hypothetical protein
MPEPPQLRHNLHQNILVRKGVPECWHRTGSSRNRHGLLKGTLGKIKNAMYLFPADGREALQKLVYG